MSTRAKLLGTAFLGSGMLAFAACDGSPGEPRVVTPQLFVSTRFEDCGKGGDQSPDPVSVPDPRLSEVLHGTWVGRRTVRDTRSLIPALRRGKEQRIHYAMIFDMRSRSGIAYEESNPAIRENGFAALLPVPAPSAPRMTYLNCEQGFRDEFVKVSPDPAAGLAALAQVTGTPLSSDASLSEAFSRLNEAGVFTDYYADVHRVGALFDLSRLAAAGKETMGLHEARLEMVAQYSGAQALLAHDGATSAVEGGVVQGVSTPLGDYLVGATFSSTKVCEIPTACSIHEQGGGDGIQPPSPAPEQVVMGAYRMVLGPIP
jgi:hypothetical protein